MSNVDYLDLLNDVGNNYQDITLAVVVCSARVLCTMVVLSATSDQNTLSGLVRNGLVVWISMFIAWGQAPGIVEKQTAISLMVIMFKEGLIGLVLGYAMSTVFWAAESIGSYIDNIAGYNNVQQTNPSSGTQSTPVGQLLSQLAITGFYMLGGLMSVISIVFESFQWWPLTQNTPPLGNMLERFVESQVTVYMLAVAKIGAPIMLMLVLIDLGFGLLSKTADKLEANSLAQPVKGAAALLMVSFLVAMYFQQLSPELALTGVLQELRRWFAGGIAGG